MHHCNSQDSVRSSSMKEVVVHHFWLMQKAADLSRMFGLVCGPAVLEVSACEETRVKVRVDQLVKVAFSHRHLVIPLR